jgi:hypothetical protein
MKAKLFVDRANEHDQASQMFAFWSALSLECLARAALTHVHPALNADPREDVNLLYGFGFELTAKARSLPAHSVYIRLEKIVQKFGKSHRELCEFVALQRNAYVHTSDLPYENLSTAKWLPRFYETAMVLNEFVGKGLVDFLGDEVAASAVALIKTLNEELIGAVKSKISAHAKVFKAKSAAESKALSDASLAATLSLAFGQQAAKCPACGSNGIITGMKVKEFPEKYEDGQLLMDIQFLSSEFKCPACSLTLNGVEEVAHAGLGTHFVETTATSLHDLYEPDYGQEYDNM